MTDFNKLKDIFIMAEVLAFEGEDYLEIEAFDIVTGDPVTVTLGFNEDAELVGVNTNSV